MKIYLACPYTHSSPDIRTERFQASCDATADLLKAGHIVFSPITQSHPVAISKDLPLTFEFWQKQNHEFIQWCDVVMVLMLDGWEQSVGIKDELEYAEQLNKRIEYKRNVLS